MANNRIHVVCQICQEKNPSDDAILIAKYYPNTGWYRKLDGMDERLDKFFEKHAHNGEEGTGGMWGYHITIQREINPD